MKPLLAALVLLMFVTRAHALILVHKGNDPTADHDWPAGAVDVANLKTRAGYWEGPPFGAAGYTPADGSVCRGEVYDMVGSKPVAGATVSIEDAATGKTGADGKFEVKNVAPGSYRIVVTSPQHASRVVGYASFAGDTLKQYT